MSHTKEEVLSIYNALKSQNDGLPLKYRDFLKASKINKRELIQIFGADAYTKLQELSGDTPNKLILNKTPIDEIMRTYGDLASEVIEQENRLPTSSHWMGKRLSPTESGLSKVHGIKWSELPEKFHKFCSSNSELRTQYRSILKFIETSNIIQSHDLTQNKKNKLFNDVYSEILKWSPALRRNSEEAYKSELSNFLKQLNYLKQQQIDVREEKGDSRCDIAIGEEIGIEIKKSPSLSEYDRCFGQIARHLKFYKFVIVIIFDVPRQEQFEDFNLLVDKYFSNSVSIIKNG